MTDPILILSAADDVHAQHIARLLSRRGAEVLVFDPGQFPVGAMLSVTVSRDGEPRRVLTTVDRAIDLEALTAVWFRRPSAPKAHPDVADRRAREYIERTCTALTAELWDALRCRKVPAPDAVTRYAGRKTSQLMEAGRLGFELPPTLITTDPDEFLDFYCAHDGRVITKALAPMKGCGGQRHFSRFTQVVATRDVGYAGALRLCPVIVQASVPKALELRVTVVGGQVFAAEIHSQESNRTKGDWRRYDLRLTPHRIHELPDAAAERCRRLVERLGLCYGAIDLILTPDGRYIFLEINPSGQYLWIENATGLPISDAVCDLLLGNNAARDVVTLRFETA